MSRIHLAALIQAAKGRGQIYNQPAPGKQSPTNPSETSNVVAIAPAQTAPVYQAVEVGPPQPKEAPPFDPRLAGALLCRRCFVCGCIGFCEHRQLDVELAIIETSEDRAYQHACRMVDIQRQLATASASRVRSLSVSAPKILAQSQGRSLGKSRKRQCG